MSSAPTPPKPAQASPVPATVAPPKAELSIAQKLGSEWFKAEMAKALPSHMDATRLLRVAMTQLRGSRKLQECTWESLAGCLLKSAAFGLEPDGRRAHLVPFGTECTLIIDYKGIVELAMRNGDVAMVHADIVCENDDFEYNLGVVRRHRIDFRKPRGEFYAAYAVVRKKDGVEQACVMTKEEIDAIRKRSRSASSGPWVTDYAEMAKKTAFRRLSKWLVLSPEIRDAVEYGEDESRDDAIGHLQSRMSELQAKIADKQPPVIQVDAIPEGAEA